MDNKCLFKIVSGDLSLLWANPYRIREIPDHKTGKKNRPIMTYETALLLITLTNYFLINLLENDSD